MEKIIYKLDKISRRKISVAYANDKFSKELDKMSSLANYISEALVNTFEHNIGKENFNNIINTMKKFNYYNSFYPEKYNVGVVVDKLYTGKSSQYSNNIPFKIYKENCFKLVIHESNDYSYFTNIKQDNEHVYYAYFINKNDLKELYELKSLYENIYSELQKSESNCYELLKKVRTAELLMKHWSLAYKYLPSDMEVEEPKTLSLSEKFDLL